MDCLQCDYWKQLAFNGEDICLQTEDENGLYLVIPPEGEAPEWCPLSMSDEELNEISRRM